MPQFNSDNQIIWRNFEDTISRLRERLCPVLVFVLDEDPAHGPFLRELLQQVPQNQTLAHALGDACAPMLLKRDQIPEYLGVLGAGTDYHVALLSPSGFTPLVIFNHLTGNPKGLADEIATVVTKVSSHWT